MQFLDALNGFRNALRDLAHFLDARLSKEIHPALEFRNDPALHGVESHRGEAHQRVLHEDEEESRDQEATLVHGERKGIADEAAEGLDLLRHHGDQFARAHAPEVRRGKAQDSAVELVAQPPQHALPQKTLVDIDDVLEAAVGEHEGQEETTVEGQQPQAFHLAQGNAEDDERAQVR